MVGHCAMGVFLSSMKPSSWSSHRLLSGWSSISYRRARFSTFDCEGGAPTGLPGPPCLGHPWGLLTSLYPSSAAEPMLPPGDGAPGVPGG